MRDNTHQMMLEHVGWTPSLENDVSAALVLHHSVQIPVRWYGFVQI